jgi:hypothetical protein
VNVATRHAANLKIGSKTKQAFSSDVESSLRPTQALSSENCVVDDD